MQKLFRNMHAFLLALVIGLNFFSFQVSELQAKLVDGKRKTKATAETKSKQKSLEMVFVLDTTGSMGGLINGAKQKIWGIVNDVMQRQDRLKVKIGLIAYRDNSDAYVTKILALTDDLDKVYSTLMDYQAEGGGDTPENVRRALAEGVSKAGWSQPNANTAQIIFLVGDAPPQNYVQEPDVLATTARAVRQNMVVNTIQCGDAVDTRQIWQTIALRGEGKYFAIAQDGGVQAISTPYDARLADLATKIGTTYLPYSSGDMMINGRQLRDLPINGREFRELQMTTQSAADSKIAKDAPMAAQAERAMNKAINSVAYQNDLIQAVEEGKVKVEEVKKEDLPDSLNKLSPAELKAEVARRMAERKQIRAEILELSKKRDEFIKAERAKMGKQDGFDAAVSGALREQMLKKGFR